MRKAFTLVEVLAVALIMAVLAALLFPVLLRGIESGRRARCIQNLKQIGVAVGLYVNDWDDHYPWAYSSSNARYGYRPALPEALNDYVSDERIWACPGDTGEVYLNSPVGYGRRTPPFWKFTGASYHWPGIGLHENQLQLAGMSTKRIRLPSQSVFSWEGRPWHDPNSLREGLRSPALFNVLYCDGHVASRTAMAWILDQFDAF